MKVLYALLSALVLCVVLLPMVLAQGPLAPPPDAFDGDGKPIGHMKTLNQVEPRYRINSIPYTITNSGSYFITENLTATQKVAHGITVQTNDVQIDLNGFALLGEASQGYSDGAAVWIDPELYNVTVRNGVIRNWRQGGIYGYGTYDGRAEKIIGYSNGGGEYSDINVAKEWNVIDCVSYSSGSNGIWAYAACVVKDCMAFNAKYAGIAGDLQCRIDKCLVYGNDVAGIRIGDSGTVQDCIVMQNDNDGIFAVDNNRIRNNNCGDNGKAGTGAGICVSGAGNRIEANTVNGNQYGIQVTSTNNFTIKNSEVGSAVKAYDIADGNFTGEILQGKDLPPLITTSNPWANFDF